LENFIFANWKKTQLNFSVTPHYSNILCVMNSMRGSHDNGELGEVHPLCPQDHRTADPLTFFCTFKSEVLCVCVCVCTGLVKDADDHEQLTNWNTSIGDGQQYTGC
jgi:hypothetical protein